MNKLKHFRSWRFLRAARHKQHWRAALVGLAAGVVGVLFQRSLSLAEGARIALLSNLHFSHSYWGILVLPLIAGIIGAFVGWLTKRYAPDAAGSGIPHVKGVLMHVKEFPWVRILFVKFFGGLLSIGAGFSLGREGPTVQMGAATGRAVADFLRVPEQARPRLLACGAGAGLAAAFHAPLAGFVFIVEELQRELSPLTYGMALIAAVVADIVTTSSIGHATAFHVSGFPAAPLTAMPLFIVIGIMAGLLGVGFNKALLAIQRQSKKTRLPNWLRAGMIGAVIGLVAWWLPEAIGSGHHVAEEILHGDFAASSDMVGFLCLLFVGKFLMTVVSYAAGVPGGIFAPMLVLGSVLGLSVGLTALYWMPTMAESPAAFSVIGMAAFFSAVVRAPLTGIVLVLEMTGDYQQLLPLLAASMIAYLVAERLQSKPIYDALLSIDLEQDNGVSSAGVKKPIHPNPVLLEFVVQEDSTMDGAAIKTLGLPEKCLIVSVTREGRDLVPSGKTVLQGGDHVTAVVSGTNAAAASVTVNSLSKVL